MSDTGSFQLSMNGTSNYLRTGNSRFVQAKDSLGCAEALKNFDQNFYLK
jgi:hypothetical protein